jgi:hypothetical protein
MENHSQVRHYFLAERVRETERKREKERRWLGRDIGRESVRIRLDKTKGKRERSR